MIEVRHVPSLPGYFVSSLGDVWHTRFDRSRRIEPRPDRSGARIVTVTANGKSTTKSVHRLVLEAFHGKQPAGWEAKFLDGDRGNPRASNLVWHRPPRAASSDKPPKPYEGFPLFPHASGRWAKKIGGKFQYFGPWDDWRAALTAYQQWVAPQSRPPDDVQHERDLLTVKHLADRFYTDKAALVASGELTERSLRDYDLTARRIVRFFGRDKRLVTLSHDDFARLRCHLAETRDLTALGNEITRVRILFGYAGPKKLGWLPSAVAFGPSFVKPSRKSMRIKRSADPERLFRPVEIRAALRYASPQLRAMILLGINCGLGNTDCGSLTVANVDLDGWLTYPRPKTGIYRRAALWTETRDALRVAWAARPANVDPAYADYWFITRTGRPWLGKKNESPVGHAFYMLLRKYWIDRPGLSFYALRHTFQTIAEGCGDFPAISLAMGHADDTMAARYRERIEDSRLERVADTVRKWLFS